MSDTADRIAAEVMDQVVRPLMAERGELEAIVRDLAAATVDVDVAFVQQTARDWVSAHPVSGDPA